MEEAKLRVNKFGKTKSLVENQYYGSYNSEMVIGYLKNRTYNLHTAGCLSIYFNNPPDYYLHNPTIISINDIKLDESIKIISLKNLTKYYVDWYSFKDGNYIKTDYVKTTFNGSLKLDFPTLSADNPVVWYVVHKNAYSGMIQNETPIEENERVVFDFQPIESDTMSSNFKNAIYPNPFDKKIIVNSLEDDVFVISTLAGGVVLQQKVIKGINNVNVQDLPKGLYFGKLINQQFVIKLERL